VLRGDTEPDLRGVVRLPVFEAPRIRTQVIPAVGAPGGGVQVDEGRLEALEQVAADVEERGAARAPQKLASGRRQGVALELAHVQRELTNRLAGIKKQG